MSSHRRLSNGRYHHWSLSNRRLFDRTTGVDGRSLLSKFIQYLARYYKYVNLLPQTNWQHHSHSLTLSTHGLLLRL